MNILTRWGAASLLVASFSAPASTAALDQSLSELRAVAGQDLLLTQAQYQNSARVLRTRNGAPLLRDFPQLDAESRARQFLQNYGLIVGLEQPDEQLVLQRIDVNQTLGLEHVRFEQRQAGLPVFGGEVVVHLSPDGIVGVTGAALQDLSALPTTASIRLDQAQQIARNAAAKASGLAPDSLSINDSPLSYYNHGVLTLRDSASHLAYAVSVQGEHFAQQIWVDAINGQVLNQIDALHSALYRKIYSPEYDPNNEDANLQREEGDPPVTPSLGDSFGNPIDNLYDFAGYTYDYYSNAFGRDSYDDAGAIMRSVYLINDACPNAYWDGATTNYCPGFDADDIVSHEWGHAVTQSMDNLVYQYQSGALNEAYSDIFGETVDLFDGVDGALGGSDNENYYEDGGVRWVVGEDLSETAAALLLRDMWDPDNFPTPSPGSVTSENYFCGASDGGGVHTNSGVANHAYAMLVDGKSFNGVDIPGIGFPKAMAIYYHAKFLQVRTTNYAEHADALEMACSNLIGQPINDYFGAPAEPISGADCDALAAAIAAVEYRVYPAQCNYQPLLLPEPETPELCPEGEGPVRVAYENFAASEMPAGWTLESSGVTTDWPDYNWEITSEFPTPRDASNGQAAFAFNDIGGTCAPGGDISGSFAMISPEITLAEDQSKLSFTHYVATEFQFDGGNLLLSVNGGAFEVVDEPNIVFNGYNGELESALNGNTNPKAGQMAWNGSDEGEATSQWGTTIVELDGLAAAGDVVQFKWELGIDGCNGNDGWYVDELQVFSCKAGVTNPGPALPGPGGETPTASGSRGGALQWWLLILALPLLHRRRFA